MSRSFDGGSMRGGQYPGRVAGGYAGGYDRNTSMMDRSVLSRDMSVLSNNVSRDVSYYGRAGSGAGVPSTFYQGGGLPRGYKGDDRMQVA
jgi:hypothetical protein